MQSPIHNRVDTIFVHVRDLKKSVQWYCNLLGLEFKEGSYEGPIYTLDMGNGRPGLTFDNHCFDTFYEFSPSNQPLFNLSTPDIHAAFDYVKKLGAEIVTEIEVFPDLSDFTFIRMETY